jgi:L-alanine-DL-glutamate epimerase-like enolase superfamily enzyme
LVLGDTRIERRNYVLVTLATEAGWTGRSFALTRDLPIDRIIADLAQAHVVGGDSDRVVHLHDMLVRGTRMAGGCTGAVAKAIGLLDTALWDAKARRAHLPLWRLLGGGRVTNPGLLVAAYPDATRDVGELAESVLEYARRGFRLLKIARDPDLDRMVHWLEALGAGLPAGSKLVVDCAWAYRTPAEALAELTLWPKLPVAWVEDPMAPEDAPAFARLRHRSPFPIAAGDEVGNIHVLRDLLSLDAVDVLRIDVSCLGITGAYAAAGLAAAARVPVSYHVYPEISVHLAAARAEGAIVESFDPVANPYDPTRMLLNGGAVLGPGSFSAPEEDGLGFTFVAEPDSAPAR